MRVLKVAFVLTLLLSSQPSFAATCRDCATVLKSDGGAINPFFGVQARLLGAPVKVFISPSVNSGPTGIISPQAIRSALGMWNSQCSQYPGIPDFELVQEGGIPTDREVFDSIEITYDPDSITPVNTQGPGYLLATQNGTTINLFALCAASLGVCDAQNRIEWDSPYGIQIIAHEIGHVLGLGHDKDKSKGCSQPSLMAEVSSSSALLTINAEQCQLASDLNNTNQACGLAPGTLDSHPCALCQYQVSGTIEGLASEQSVNLVLNISGSNYILANMGSGPFSFPNLVPEGYSYSVKATHSSPSGTCSVQNGQGAVQGADVTDVRVQCQCPTTEQWMGQSLLANLAEGCELPDRGYLFDVNDGDEHLLDICAQAPWMCGPELNPWWWFTFGPPTGKEDCQKQTICTWVSSTFETEEGDSFLTEILTCRDQCVSTASSRQAGPSVAVDETGLTSASGTLHFTGMVQDSDGIHRLWIYVDGIRVSEELVTIGTFRPEICAVVEGDCDPFSGFEGQIDTTQLVNGTHRIDVVALDNNREYGMGTRVTREITVDNSCTATAAPSIAMDLPLDGQVVRGDILLRAMASTPDPAETTVERVHFYLDGFRIGTDWTAPYELSLDTVTVPDGFHTLSARARDTCGGLADSSPVTIDVLNANEPPRIEVEVPFDSAEVSGNTVTVSGWALDEDGISSVSLRLNGQLVATTPLPVSRPEICTALGEMDPRCPEVGWSLTFDSSALPDGFYTLKVIATDRREGTASVNRAIEIRNRPPLPPGTTPPQSATVVLGGAVTFDVTVFGTGPFSYLWQVREGQRWRNLDEGSRGGRVTGTTTGSLTITAIDYGDAGGYRCLVSNAGGTSATVSASLTVVETLAAPAVTTGIDQVVTEGAVATLTVAAEGTGPITYQWQKWNGTTYLDVANDGRISGATSDTLGIGDALFEDAGRYRCIATNPGGSTPSGTIDLAVRFDLTGSCVSSPTVLCLGQDRFQADVVINGSPGQALTYSDLGGFFTRSNQENVEMAVKVLDGTSVNGRHWVFHGSATSLAYTLTVTDTVTGAQKTYFKEAGSFCGNADTNAFQEPTPTSLVALTGVQGTWVQLHVARESTAGSCKGSSTALCLLQNRFRAEVLRNGTAQRAVPVTGLSGAFTFGSSANPEVVVKVLDGTPVNDWYWVFFGSLTSQTYEVRVTDTTDGTVRTYPSPGTTCGGADTTAF